MRYGTLEFTVDPTRMAKIVSSGLTKQDSYILAMAPNIEDEQRVLFVNHVEKNTGAHFPRSRRKIFLANRRLFPQFRFCTEAGRTVGASTTSQNLEST